MGLIKIVGGHFKLNQGKSKRGKIEGVCVGGLNSYHRLVVKRRADVRNLQFMSRGRLQMGITIESVFDRVMIIF